MVRYNLVVLNIINIFVFLWIISIFTSIFDFSKVITNADNKFVLTEFITSIRNIFIYIIYSGLYLVAILTALGIASLFSFIPNFESGFSYYFIGYFFKFYLGKWFSFPGGKAPEISQIPALIETQLLIFIADLYLIIFQILFIISIIYAVRGAYKNKTKYNLIAIGCLMLMIVFPLMIIGFRDMLHLFSIKGFIIQSNVPTIEELNKILVEMYKIIEKAENPVNPVLTNLPLDNFWAFIISPMALLAIISYIYLELAFQINYTDTVTKPSLERSDRLEAQLDILKKESQLITADVDKIKQEAKARKEELKIEEREDVSRFFAKTGQRFSYVKEMIERRKLEEEEKKLVSAASKTRRLGRYIERLFKEDPEAKDTITAKSSTPKVQSLTKSTVINFTIRVGVLIIISFIIIHPKWFFVNVFHLPPAITESVSMYSPEVVLILLIPIMLLFPIISAIISYIKHRNLLIRLKQEGRIKEIITSVGDYVKKEGKEEKEEEEKEEEEKETEQEKEAEKKEEGEGKTE